MLRETQIIRLRRSEAQAILEKWWREGMEQREWDAYLEELQDSINDLKELRESLSDWTSAEE